MRLRALAHSVCALRVARTGARTGEVRDYGTIFSTAISCLNATRNGGKAFRHQRVDRAKSDGFSRRHANNVESSGQSALSKNVSGGQTAHGGVGGVYAQDVDDRLWRVEAPEAL